MHQDINRREFIATAVGAAALATTAAQAEPEKPGLSAIQFGAGPGDIGIAQSTTFPESTNTVTVADPARIRALQLTDIHFFCTRKYPENDQKTIEDLKKLVDLAQPDMLWITGDLWHDNPDGEGQGFMEFGVAEIAKLGLPWTFVWGNHDRLDDYAKGHDHIAGAAHALYRGGASGGNYTVTLQEKSGAAVWELLCLNSGGNGLSTAQKEWVATTAAARKAAGPVKPSFTLVHIPIKQYADLWASKAASGVRLEDVCNEGEDGSALPVLQEYPGMQAVFCGHDHVNDYNGKSGPIELVYGRATGHGGYGGKQVPKGAKIITMNAQAGTYSYESILADGTRWNPTPGMHIENYRDAPWNQDKPKA